MRHTIIVDKRIAGIIRWLERLNKSYTNGKMESALMEAECARADLENLRQDVWEQVKPAEIRENRFFSYMINIFRVAFLAAVIVVFAVTPLAKDIKAPAVEQTPEKIVLAEPIVIIREYEDETEQDEHTIINTAPKKSVKPKKQPVKRAGIPSEPNTNIAKAETKTANAGKVPYDQVFSLMQTGQRALKNNTSVIKVQ